ncbi:Substance-P receptor [Labeo rohita]|uniref:Substance-P receptor n=1 Tax=Labeo rohita TaxID=84645 RepID=A0ABQ8MBM4_LABRO|nr:Substance-P receptor [Labeo rohita]
MDPLYITSQNSSGNGTEGSLVNDTDVFSNQFVQPVWQIVLWAIAYCCIVLVSVVGNITVIWIILAHKRMRTVTNYFLVNLAFAEASMSAFNTVINFVYAVHNEWYFGLVYCRFHNFFPIAAVFASIYSMTAIALDRYMAIIHPLQQRLSSTETKLVVGVIWALALLLAFPQYYFSSTAQLPGRVVCYINWPEYSVWDFQKTYYVCVVGLIYFLPLLIMGCAYLVVVKMMIVVVCTFAICWLPYHVYFLLHQFLPHLFEERFRAGFQQAFSWCPCVPQGSYEGLELKSTRYLQTQASIYRASRMETTVSTVMPVTEGDLQENTNRCSIDLTSNGSSQSASKTVSESSSFYSSNNLA